VGDLAPVVVNGQIALHDAAEPDPAIAIVLEDVLDDAWVEYLCPA